MNRWTLRLGAILSIATVIAAVAPLPAMASSLDRETVWADGRAWTMLEPHLTTSPSPELLASAPPMYVLAFPQNPATGGFVLPAGYAPQCDPCLGVPVPVYHDHLLTSAPGSGQAVMAPRRPVLMVYSPAYVSGGHFAPVTDARELSAAIAAGDFLPIGGPGVYAKPLPAIIVGAVLPRVAA
jgi:hypothetical protein